MPGKYQRNLVLLIYQNAYSVVLPPIINQISINIDFEAKKILLGKSHYLMIKVTVYKENLTSGVLLYLEAWSQNI